MPRPEPSLSPSASISTQAGEKQVDLPCTGSFEKRHGQVAVWRGYFDTGTYARAIS